MKARVKTGTHHQSDNTYGPGAVFECTKAELAAFGDKFEVLEEAQQPAAPVANPLPNPLPNQRARRAARRAARSSN